MQVIPMGIFKNIIIFLKKSGGCPWKIHCQSIVLGKYIFGTFSLENTYFLFSFPFSLKNIDSLYVFFLGKYIVGSFFKKNSLFHFPRKIYHQSIFLGKYQFALFSLEILIFGSFLLRNAQLLHFPLKVHLFSCCILLTKQNKVYFPLKLRNWSILPGKYI